MEQLQALLTRELIGNSALDWAIAIGMFIVVFVALRIIRKVIVARLVAMAKKTHSKLDDVVAEFLHSIHAPFFVFIALYIALKSVSVPESVTLIVHIVALVVVVSQVIRLLEEVACFLMLAHIKKENPDAAVPGIFRVGIRLVLWILGLLLILSNAGIDVTSLVAGLGIGGLAISLALQNILADLFSSFSIAVDKPFEIGDFIVVGEHKGTVKHIGMKTTRIEALEGEEIVISNAELTSARVQNYKKMQSRRVMFSFGCTYDAKPNQLRKIADDVKEIINDHELVEVDRVHFAAFGDSDLQFEAVYYVHTSEYIVYMDTQEDINIRILEYFEQNGLEMAYPTQTLYVKKEE